jgi:hypothetical protein
MTEWTTYWEAQYQLLRRIYSVGEWEKFGTPKEQHPEAVDFMKPWVSTTNETVNKRRAHMHWMIEQLPKHVAEGKLTKAQRWVGFLHGFAVSVGMISLMDLMEQCRVIETDDAEPIKEEPRTFTIDVKGMDAFERAVTGFMVMYMLYQKTIDKVKWQQRRIEELEKRVEELNIEALKRDELVRVRWLVK